VAIIGMTKQMMPAMPRTSVQIGGSNDAAATTLANIRKTPSAIVKTVSNVSIGFDPLLIASDNA
jgi:hypothetical protein